MITESRKRIRLPVMRRKLELFEPQVEAGAWETMKVCLERGQICSDSPVVDRFERAFAERVSLKHAVATSSGTAALHLALIAAGVRPGDEVILPALSSVAPANAVRYVGANPVFIDVEPGQLQLDVEKTIEFLKRECRTHRGRWANRLTRRPVRAVLAVHTLGHAIDMAALVQVAREFEIRVIEDASQSLGALYHDKPVGSFSEISTFSFGANKTLTTGEGGMLATNNPGWTRRCRNLARHAPSRHAEQTHDELGYNYRSHGLSCSLGLAQLAGLDGFLKEKRRIAELYEKHLANSPGWRFVAESEHTSSSYWAPTVIGPQDVDLSDVRRLLANEAIETRALWQPLHLSEAQFGAQKYRIEHTESLASRGLMLPSGKSLQEGDIARIALALDKTAGRRPRPGRPRPGRQRRAAKRVTEN